MLTLVGRSSLAGVFQLKQLIKCGNAGGWWAGSGQVSKGRRGVQVEVFGWWVQVEKSVYEYRWMFIYMRAGIKLLLNTAQDNYSCEEDVTSLYIFGSLFQAWLSWGCDLYSRLRSSGDRWSGTCHDEGGGCRWFFDAVMLVVVGSNLQAQSAQNYPSLMKIVILAWCKNGNISAPTIKKTIIVTQVNRKMKEMRRDKSLLRKTRRLFRAVDFFSLESSFLTRW